MSSLSPSQDRVLAFRRILSEALHLLHPEDLPELRAHAAALRHSTYLTEPARRAFESLELGEAALLDEAASFLELTVS